MDQRFASTEIEAWENNDLAIANAIENLKERLADAPAGVVNDVLERCDPDTHAAFIDWLKDRTTPKKRRVPRDWSPKKNRKVWLLYHAANLECPANPP